MHRLTLLDGMGGIGWSEEEDELLKQCIKQNGEGNWHGIPSLSGLNRCPKRAVDWDGLTIFDQT